MKNSHLSQPTSTYSDPHRQKSHLKSPGEVLKTEFLLPNGITQYRLAKSIHRPQSAISDIIHGSRTISTEMAVLLGRALGTSPLFWLGLQAAFDVNRMDVRNLAEVEPLISPDEGLFGEWSAFDSLLRTKDTSDAAQWSYAVVFLGDNGKEYLG